VKERWLEILLTPQRDGISVAAVCRRYGIPAVVLRIPATTLVRGSPCTAAAVDAAGNFAVEDGVGG